MASGFRATRLGTIWLLVAVVAAITVSHLSGTAPAAPSASALAASATPASFDLGAGSRLSSQFGRDGVTLSAGGEGLMTLELSAIGRGSAMRALPSGTRESGPRSVSYFGAGLTQTYASRRAGLEQVFTIARRPAGDGPLRLVVGKLAPGVHALVTGGDLSLLDRSGRVLAGYGSVRVTDAHADVIPAQIRIDGRHLLLVIDDRLARYPLRVDPYVQIAELTPSAFDTSLGNSNGERSQLGATDTFGTSVTESANGNVVVVGAPDDNSAFVFVKPAHGGWTNAHPTARLETDVQAQYPELGDSVAVSADGKTIVVGEPHVMIGSNGSAGEALIYTEPSDGWHHATGYQTAILAPADPSQFGNFGAAVATDSSGDTIVVGAPGWNNEEGALYLFRRGAHGWATTTSGPAANVGEPGANNGFGGNLGVSVSMSASGDVIAVAAPNTSNYEGAVYVFGRDLAGYHELADTASGTSDKYFICSGGGGYGIFNPELGNSVAVSADGKTIVAGEPCAGDGGQAVVYSEPQHGWNTDSGDISGGLTPLRPDVFNTQFLGAIVAIAGNGSTIVADDPEYLRTGGYVATFRRPTKGWNHINPPVTNNFGSLLIPSWLAGGLYDAVQGSPLAVSSGGGNVFVGDTGTSNDGAVSVYELASDIASATTVSCSPSSLDTGKTSTCTATVKTKSPTATGKVSFISTGGSAAKFNDKDCTLKRVKTGTARCHVSFTPHQRLTYTITARYGGDNNHGSGIGTTVVDTPRNGTATKVSCTPNPVTAVSQTVCTATVTGLAVHGSSPTFKTSPAVASAPSYGVCVQTVQPGTETCTVDLTIAISGTYSVLASYAGDSLDAPSDGSTQLIVAAAMNPIHVACSPQTIYADQTLSCSATVSGIVGTAIPAIVWTANGTGWTFTNQACVATTGTETCTATFSPGAAGSVRINANFPGNASNLGGAAEEGLTVDSTVALVCTGTDAWVCTTTVTDRTANPSAPTGTITLTGGPLSSQSCTLAATSTSASSCHIDVNSVGKTAYTLTASYPGDGVHRSGSDTIVYQDPDQ
jgi:hypothetical protein